MIFAIELTNGTDEINLNSGGQLTAMQAGRVITRNGNGLIEDRFYMLGNGTKSLTVSLERTLDLIGSRSRQYASDPNFVSDRYFLVEQAEGESNPRRALIYDLEVRPLNSDGFEYLQSRNIARYEVVVTRDEWENTAQRTAITQSNMASGDKKSIAAAGTLPGRIARVLLEPGSGIGTGATATTRHWFGIRPTYSGTSGFVGEWDWTDGTMGTDTSVVGSTVVTTFNTQTAMVPRVTLKLSDIVGSNYDDFTGEYLLVTSVSTGGGGASRFGLQVSGDGVESEPIYLGSTASINQIFEVGTIRIPSQSVRDVSASLANVSIVFSAERIASTGSMTISKVYAVPMKHFCYLEGTLDSAQSSGFVALYMHPESEPLQVNSDGSVVTFNAENRAIVNWQVPVEGGIFVYVGASADGVIRDGVDLTLDIFDRWAVYRV